MHNQKQGNRIDWVDSVKALCMIGVYIVHSLSYTTPSCLETVESYILPFYVNAFFVISGFFFFKKNFFDTARVDLHILRQRLWNIVLRIILPMMFFTVVLFVPKSLFFDSDMSLAYVLKYLFGGIAYWFTSALAVCQIALLLLIFLMGRNRRFAVVLLATMALFVGIPLLMPQTEYETSMDFFPYFWRNGLIYTFVFAIGGLYYRFRAMADSTVLNPKTMPLWLAAFIVYVYFAKDRAPLLTMGIMPLYNWQGIVAMVLGICMIFTVCRNLPGMRFLRFIGRNSILFYFFSGATPAVIGSLMSRMPLPAALIQASTIVLAVISGYLLVKIMIRFMPWTADFSLLRGRGR